jgi:hypothetical protein
VGDQELGAGDDDGLHEGEEDEGDQREQQRQLGRRLPTVG